MSAPNNRMLAATARAIAQKRLAQAHIDEWEELYGDAREEIGLPRLVETSTAVNDNRQLRRRVAELEQQLRETNGK